MIGLGFLRMKKPEMPDNSSCCCFSYHNMTCFHGLTVLRLLGAVQNMEFEGKEEKWQISRREELGK